MNHPGFDWERALPAHKSNQRARSAAARLRWPTVPVSKHVVRFAAGEDPGAQSAVWRIFTHGDEIYVLPRYAGGELKTSLHASGNFRHAFSEASAARIVGERDRAFRKWREPPGEPGVVRCCLRS